MRIDDRGYRVGRIVKAVHKLETQRDEQCHAQQQEGENGSGANAGYICQQARNRINQRGRERHSEYDHPDCSGAFF